MEGAAETKQLDTAGAPPESIHGRFVENEDVHLMSQPESAPELPGPPLTPKEALMAAVQQRYAAPGWALVFEVGNETGYKQNQRADAVALSLYPSRGLELHGLEFKLSRTDWLRELKQERKSCHLIDQVDRWYVCAPRGVVDKKELPVNWGLLELDLKAVSGQRSAVSKDARGLRTVVKAPLLHDPAAPHAAPIARSFLAALLQAAQRPSSAEREREHTIWSRGYDIGCHTAASNFKRLNQLINHLERAYGRHITEEDARDLARRIRVQPLLDFDDVGWRLRAAQNNLTRQLGIVVNALVELETVERTDAQPGAAAPHQGTGDSRIAPTELTTHHSPLPTPQEVAA